jgi:hypothetical protein
MTDATEINAEMGRFHEAARKLVESCDESTKESLALRDEARRLRQENEELLNRLNAAEYPRSYLPPGEERSEALVMVAIRNEARAERERILAWLRHPDRYDEGPRAFWYANAAEAIERGDHAKPGA